MPSPTTGRSRPDAQLDWVQQRKTWNAEGYCAREACGAAHGGHAYKNDHALRYCADCAYALVVAQGDVIAWNRTPPEGAPPRTRDEHSMGAYVPGSSDCPLCDAGVSSAPLRASPYFRLSHDVTRTLELRAAAAAAGKDVADCRAAKKRKAKNKAAKLARRKSRGR